MMNEETTRSTLKRKVGVVKIGNEAHLTFVSLSTCITLLIEELRLRRIGKHLRS